MSERRAVDADRPPSSTACVHAGETPDAATGAVEPPLHLSSAYAFDSAEQAAGAFTAMFEGMAPS